MIVEIVLVVVLAVASVASFGLMWSMVNHGQKQN